MAFDIAHDDYRGGDLSEAMQIANEEVLFIAQIETAGGVEEADAVPAVEGIDALGIGQYDLSASLGIPGRFDPPDFHRAVGRVLEACHRRGKIAALGSGDVETLRRGPAEGFRMLVYLADVWIYQQALRQALAAVHDDGQAGSGRVGGVSPPSGVENPEGLTPPTRPFGTHAQ